MPLRCHPAAAQASPTSPTASSTWTRPWDGARTSSTSACPRKWGATKNSWSVTAASTTFQRCPCPQRCRRQRRGAEAEREGEAEVEAMEARRPQPQQRRRKRVPQATKKQQRQQRQRQRTSSLPKTSSLGLSAPVTITRLCALQGQFPLTVFLGGSRARGSKKTRGGREHQLNFWPAPYCNSGLAPTSHSN